MFKIAALFIASAFSLGFMSPGFGAGILWQR
jgi:hypothetical protein